MRAMQNFSNTLPRGVPSFRTPPPPLNTPHACVTGVYASSVSVAHGPLNTGDDHMPVTRRYMRALYLLLHGPNTVRGPAFQQFQILAAEGAEIFFGGGLKSRG